MYDIKYECRYNRDDVFLDTDKVNDEEKNFIRNILYREDLMNILNISDKDDFDILNIHLSILFQKIKNYSPLMELMKKLSAFLLSEDEELGLCLLYSYDYMYITHDCISEYLETGSISQQNMELLNKMIAKLQN